MEAALSGRAPELKEYTVGLEVFARPTDYNPQIDPIVRIMAGRVRAKLAEYYVGPGSGDPIVIELPRGGYVPEFLLRVPDPPRSFPAQKESVGREAETESLQAVWFKVVSKGGRMLTVSGDAGIGKATFVEDFLGGLADTDVVVARGRCSERLAETDAFAPILDALDGLMRGGGRAAKLLESVAPSWHAQVANTQNTPASHERLRREFVAFLEELTRVQPAIIFLDDLHWADASTCDLLAYLGQRMRSLAVLVIATFRPGAILGDSHPFLPLKLRLESWGISHEIPLPFLTRGNVKAYLAHQFPGNRFPEELASIVHERTEGHPLFLTDLVRYLVDTGVLAAREGEWRLERSADEVRSAIPAGTHAMIAVKLREVAEADRQLLRWAAVQGVEFDPAVLAQVAGMDLLTVEERLAELDRVHRLVSTEEPNRAGPPAAPRYRFRHVYYQNALYALLTPSRRAADSLAVAHVLAGRGEERSLHSAAEIAVLYEIGRDHPNAARYFLEAARNSARVFAYPEAILLCERGLKPLAMLPESRLKDEQELVYTLTLGMAMMSSRGYAAPEVEQTYRRARSLCVKLSDVRRLGPVLWAIHTCVTNAGKLTEALEVAVELRQIADTSGYKASIVESLHALGTTLAFMGRLKEARETLERIFEIMPVAGHEFRSSLYVIDPMVTSLSMLARLVTLMGDFEAGRRKAEESLKLAQRLGHPHSTVYARFWIGWVLQTGGDHQSAIPHLDEAMELGRTHNLPLVVEWARVVRGAALVQLGQVEAGVAEIRDSIEQQETMGSGLERPYCLTLLAEGLLELGDAAQALIVCDQALELADRTQSLDFQPETHRKRGEALHALGHPECDVRAEFETGLRLASDSGCVLLETRIAATLQSLLPGNL